VKESFSEEKCFGLEVKKVIAMGVARTATKKNSWEGQEVYGHLSQKREKGMHKLIGDFILTGKIGRFTVKKKRGWDWPKGKQPPPPERSIRRRKKVMSNMCDLLMGCCMLECLMKDRR